MLLTCGALESIWFVCVRLCPYLGGGRRARTGLIHRSIAGTCCRSSPSESSPGTAVGWFRSPEPAGDATADAAWERAEWRRFVVSQQRCRPVGEARLPGSLVPARVT